MTLRLRLGHY